MHSKTELRGKHSNFEFEAKLYHENVSKLKYCILYAISEKLLKLGNKIILEHEQDISAGLF